jgi:hypothetical protein
LRRLHGTVRWRAVEHGLGVMSEIIPSRVRAPVSDLLEDLNELGVVIVKERYEDDFAAMRVEIHKVMVGFVRYCDDPGCDWEMQIASVIGEWFGPEVWRALLDGTRVCRKQFLSFGDQAAFLVENFPRILAVRRADTTSFRLRDLEPDIRGLPKSGLAVCLPGRRGSPVFLTLASGSQGSG